MAELFQVSQSKVKKFLQCKKAYYYRYIEHLKKRAKSRPLQFGTIVHEMLEADANGDCAFERLDEIAAENSKLFKAEIEMYGDLVADARMIMEAYFEYYEDEPLRHIRYKKQRAEHWIEVEIAPGIKLVMKIDGFVRTRNKLKWLLENKTGKNQMSQDDKWRNIQISVYHRAVEMVGGPKLDGVMWNFVTSKSPTRPALLKNGTLSTKAIVTLPGAVDEAIKHHGLDPDDYEGLYDMAEGCLPRYFERDFTPINRQIIDVIFNDFVQTAQEMADYSGPLFPRTVDRHCGWCDYESICRAELTGGDADFVKEREYEPREDQENREKEDDKKVKPKPRKKKAR